MRHVFNYIFVLFSLCMAVLIGMKSIPIGIYIGLMAAEYLVLLLMNSEFRRSTLQFFRRKGAFGEGSSHYEAVHLETLKEDIERIEPFAFEYFIRDVFKALGYKTKVTTARKDFGGDVIARKGEECLVIQVRHRESDDETVGNDAIQKVVAAMPVYKANKSMVITNAVFTEQAYKLASYTHTELIDGTGLMNLVRQLMTSTNPQEEAVGMPVVLEHEAIPSKSLNGMVVTKEEKDEAALEAEKDFRLDVPNSSLK